MRGINQVIIIGRLGADPETRQFSNGGSVTNISVATSEQWTDKNTGEKREATEWHRISLFNRLGEIAAQYLKKGSQVYIEGSLRTRKWQDQNGQDRYTTEIRADKMQMLGSTSEINRPPQPQSLLNRQSLLNLQNPLSLVISHMEMQCLLILVRHLMNHHFNSLSLTSISEAGAYDFK